MPISLRDPQPSSPDGWKKYSEAVGIKEIPMQTYELLEKEARRWTKRSIYWEYPKTPIPEVDFVRVVADVICFQGEVLVDLSKSKISLLHARVVTATSKINLRFKPDTEHACIFVIYASALDKPISFSVEGEDGTEDLQLGPQFSPHVGVEISFKKGSAKPEVHYVEDYTGIEPSDQFQSNLETQLRIASVLFWKYSTIALSQAAYVAQATSQTKSQAFLNLQAASIGQQLAAKEVTGPDMSYAPVLSFDLYYKTTEALINAADGFEQQYQLVQNKAEEIEDRLKAWDLAAKHAENVADMRRTFVQAALEKYNQSAKIVDTLKGQFEDDKFTLRNARSAFVLGIEEWKDAMKFKAAFALITAVIDFAVAIGTICSGAGSPAGDVKKTVEAVEEAEKDIKAVGSLLKSNTLKDLFKALGPIFKLFPTVKTAITSIEELIKNPKAGVDEISDVIGGAADASAIISLGAWDKWTLESDAQLAFAVEQDIKGAAAYRLELRKHAVNGKQLVQAQAETIKAGQEYIHLQLELNLCKRDIEDLKKFREEFEKKKALEEEAMAKFYDRFMSIRTSITLVMRSLMWAYKYAALGNSSVELDCLKDTNEYKTDLATLQLELTRYKEKYPGGFEKLTPISKATVDLPPPFSAQIVASLKTAPYSASFTLAPCKSDTPESQSLAGPFDDASHFRITGLHVFLVGAKPKVISMGDNHSQYELRISTSGVYADIENDKIFQFTSPPLLNKPFDYSDAPGGRYHIERDSIVESDEYSQPTPFTKWTITIKNPDSLDLTGLTDVRLEWSAKAYTQSAAK
ncbi:uncharacterized protein GIQ15_02153 [Arthroderma uncinatum]|uniref:uncharacterized protein n=1 Tax=Arthroderma uncinatum TaxID=74035 RepID=UPI00144AAFD7|nr:uncharacterized protein GIQ15_02153 [Arthroderma uncinatum]KAF3482829.1 hypothetical protein GIQ15_02153 [Arthroderma uncinatum]